MTVNVAAQQAISTLDMSVSGQIADALFMERRSAPPAEQKKEWDLVYCTLEVLLDLVEERRDVINP